MNFSIVKEILKKVYKMKKDYYEDSVEAFRDLLDRLDRNGS